MTNRRESHERHAPHATTLGIHLDKGDLAELWLRRRHADSLREQYSHGAMSFPRNQVLRDQLLSECISLLETEGRAKVDLRLQKHGGDATSGNVVVYTKPDESVGEVMNGASTKALDPVLRLFAESVVPMDSVTVLSNTSSTTGGKAKGVVIETSAQADRWWRDLHGLDWALGRGMRIVSLDINADQFIDRSDFLLKQAYGMSKAMAHGSLKYVWFLHDQCGQMFMAVAGGPTRDEAIINRQTLAKISRRTQAQAFINEQREQYRERRDKQVAVLAAALGISPQELATDVTYIDLNMERGTLVSGASDNALNGLLPYTVGTAGIILHLDDSNEVAPIGTKLINQARGYEPMLPPNIKEPHRLSQVPTTLFAAEDIRQHIATFSRPIELQTLALGFHSDWR